MIDIEKCKKVFFSYIESYDMCDSKINLKVIHSLKVLQVASYLADALNLNEEDKNLCMLIALLHDIGRFEQIKRYETLDDSKSVDHAQLGVKILFNDGLIRKFIDEDKYDSIIYKAIMNHNKYKIEEGLSEKELLHAKIIRDADKIDIFRVEYTEDMQTLINASELELGHDRISNDVYNDFLNHRLIERKKVVTKLDKWLSNIAYIYDLNYSISMRYLLENSYIEKLFERIKYSNSLTKEKISILKKCAIDYANSSLVYN